MTNPAPASRPAGQRPTPRLARRAFLRQTALGGAGLFVATGNLARAARTYSAGEKLNIGIIGVAGQGGFSVDNLKDQNIVALCDIDDKNLANASARFPSAKTYSDFRRLVDQKDIDAIVVATPDHTHAVASMAALKSGRHLYCEKPLARTIAEARIVTETARKRQLITQIGTQIHAGGNYRRVVELVQSGSIGPVREVHVWVGSSYGGRDLPSERPPVPAHIHYDLWLGPVPEVPYNPAWVPFGWRNWWAFGGGSLADFGCHYMDLPHWALDLRHPLSAEADGPPVHPHSTPPWLIVRYEHPARDPISEHWRDPKGKLPPVKLTWYHGGKHPSLLTPEQYDKWKSGVLFIGEKGMLVADYGRHALWPEKEFAGFVAPAKFIPDSIGHHKEWVQAIKTGGKTTCTFDYSGPLSETALLGNVAYRVGRKLDWDARKMRAAHCPEADAFIHPQYRKGWSV